MIKNRETIGVIEKTGYIYPIDLEVISNCKCKNRKFVFKDKDIVYEKNKKSLIGEIIVCNKCNKELGIIKENPQIRYIEIEDKIRLVEYIRKCNCNMEKMVVNIEKNIICLKCREIKVKTKEIELTILGKTRCKNFLELKYEIDKK